MLFFNARQLKFKFYGAKSHPMFGARPIFGIEKESSNNYWMTAMGGLFNVRSSKEMTELDSFIFYSYPKQIPIFSSLILDSNFLWAGSFVGLHKFYPKEGRFEKIPIDFAARSLFESDILKLVDKAKDINETARSGIQQLRDTV